jgi:hypothetical protein
VVCQCLSERQGSFFLHRSCPHAFTDLISIIKSLAFRHEMYIIFLNKMFEIEINLLVPNEEAKEILYVYKCCYLGFELKFSCWDFEKQF